MNGGYWYVEGAEGERFAWAKDPTFTCPFRDSPPRSLTDAAETMVEDWPEGPELEALDRAWRKLGHGYRRRVDGRLTDRCTGCGARMERKGFAAWAEREAERDGSTPGDRIVNRLGFGPRAERTIATRYFRTKRQAEEWARKQAKKSREKAGEREAA